MALMNTALAALIPSEARAQMLFNLDRYLRDNLLDEDLFDRWLEEGVPDGTHDWHELTYISATEFAEMWNLAEGLLNEQAEQDACYEPGDIDDDTGYNPYSGCMDWDC